MLIVANWKAYVTDLKSAKALTRAANRVVSKQRTIMLAPSAVYLAYVRDNTKKGVACGTQDISLSEQAASTGENTAEVVIGAGATFSILGHSERRANGETSEIVAHKVRRALAAGLQPVVCVGEQVRDEEAEYLGFVRQQIASVYEAVSPEDRRRIILAYEPVWAIGKEADRVLGQAELREMVSYIRKCLEQYLSPTHAAAVPVLYGGSVDASNVRMLIEGTGIQGLLVGRASTDPARFAALVKAAG